MVPHSQRRPVVGVALQALALVALAGALFVPADASAEFVWRQWTGSFPEKVVYGGQENGGQLAICRVNYRNGKHPGKVVAGNCNIGWGGNEIVERNNFEVLTYRKGARATWAASSGGRLPAKSWKASRYDGGVGHVCRANYKGGVHPGKVVAGKCNIGWGGREIVLTSYEVLLAPHRAGADTGGGKAQCFWMESKPPYAWKSRPGVSRQQCQELDSCNGGGGRSGGGCYKWAKCATCDRKPWS